MASLQHLAPTATAEEVEHQLRTVGAVIIDDLATSDVLDRVAAEMQPHIDATPSGSDDFSGRNTRRTGGLVARSQASHELIRHPLVLDVTGRLLDRAKNYQLHLTQMIAIGPDSASQQLHRDQWAFDFFEFPSDYHVQCNTIWAMTDFTADNGATRFVPGSQELPDRTTIGHDDVRVEAAEMRRGSCFMYTGKVFHGGGANVTDETRVGINVTYNVAWLRQEENQYLSVPADVAAELDDEMLRLIGYRIGAYALGYIDDVRDPLEAIRGGSGEMSFGASPVAT